MSRSYEDMFRPTYEAPAFASWSAASVLLTITQPPLWPAFAFATLGMAGTGGGTLVVTPGTISTANDSVKYTITHVPDAACLPLVSSLTKGAGTVRVGTNDVKVAGGKPDPSKVQCSGDNNTLEFQYF